MKVALINPPMDFNVALGKAKAIGRYTVMIPHGLASIASLLRENNIDCIIIDAYAEGMTIGEMIKKIVDYGADFVGISAVTPVMPIVYAIAKSIKKQNKNTYVVVGGPHPSVLPDEAMADGNIDFIVRGEGECTLLNLLHSIEKKSDLKELNGISYRKDGKVVHNKPADYIKDLNTLPDPAYDLLPMHLYKTPPQWSIASPSYQVIASRGCPYNCGFCCVGMGKTVRYKSGVRVCNEIELLIEKYNCKQVVFADTTFPFSTKHCEEVCNRMIETGLSKKIVWFTSTRVDIVNQKMLDLMYKAGCRLVTFGVESGSQRILDLIKKGITLKQVKDAVRMAKRAKIDVTASYILGLPDDTRQTILNTIKFAKSLGTLYAQFNIIVPYPSTDIYKYAEEKGLLRNKNWNNYVSLTSLTDLDPPFIAEGLSKEELLKLQRKAYNNYYFRPSMAMRHIKKGIKNREFKKYIDLAKVLFKTFK